MAMRTDRIDYSRLAIPAFVVVIVVFSGFRFFGIQPWVLPGFDAFAYWETRFGVDYSAAHQGATGAFLYSPAFAQLIAPLVALPWTVFLGLWTAVLAAPLAWLAGRYALPLLILPPVFMSVASGQLDLVFAAVILLGLRWPFLWALPILTKITPGIGLLWFFVRGEWRSLGIALVATAGVAAVSAAAAPEAWGGWLAMLARMDFPELGGGLWFLPLPLAFRLFVAAALIAWGAATDRTWVLPLGVCLSLPTVWLNSPAILVAILPMVAAGAPTPAGAWLRRSVPRRGPRALDLVGQRRRLEAWFRRTTTT
jgi:Glycosyltransferase family 87